jgi:hypothetical protein
MPEASMHPELLATLFSTFVEMRANVLIDWPGLAPGFQRNENTANFTRIV